MLFKTPINVVHKKTGNMYRIVGLTKNCTNKNEGQILLEEFKKPKK